MDLTFFSKCFLVCVCVCARAFPLHTHGLIQQELSFEGGSFELEIVILKLVLATAPS